MMNMIELQEQLKDFSQQQLVQEMKMPSGNVPQYLVLSEMQRRKRMQAAAAGDQGRPQTTVAEDAVAAAGVPQGGIAQMARTMAPQTDMAQNTGVAAMAGGGAVRRMQPGGLAGISRDVGDYAPTEAEEDWQPPTLGTISQEDRDLVDAMARRFDVSPEEAFETLSESGEFEPTYIEEPTPPGFGSEIIEPRMEQVDPESPFVSQVWQFLQPAPGTTRGDMLTPDQQLLPSQEELAAAGIEPPVPEAPEAPEAPEDDTGGAGGPSAADRLAQQDRWLTLARFGLGLMSSDQPTFGGAIGEAGMNALDYMQGMEQQRFERDLAERTLAARSAGSSRPPISLDNYIGVLQAQLDGAQERLTNLSLDPNAPRTAIAEAEQDVANARASLQQAIGAGGMTFGFGPATQTLTQTLIDARDSATS
jgi:hypothetical protein